MADKGQHSQTRKINQSLAGDRIAKAIARAGLCSRREAEAWIEAGRVAVNGAVIKSPALNVTSTDRIAVDGMPLPQRERTRLFLFHKPRGLVTTHADPEGRPTIFAALPKTLPRLLSVGRLDMNTEGLLLLTNDGGLARILELPKTGWLRRYRVRANGRVAPETLKGLRDGITIDGIRYGGIDAEIEREQGANLWLTFAMREGKNREVKNVLGHLGLAVNRLIRVSFGPFQLGQLERGAIEEVRTRHLREQLGERVAAAAGSDFSAPIILRREEEPVRRPAEIATRPAQDSGRQEARSAGGRSTPQREPQRPRGKPRRSDAERMGEPAMARRERRQGLKFGGQPPGAKSPGTKPPGTKPTVGPPRGGKPHRDKSHSATSHGSKSHGSKSHGAKTYGAKSHRDKSHRDKSH
jgi:23S rRNA pseudouridine2605 synthase